MAADLGLPERSSRSSIPPGIDAVIMPVVSRNTIKRGNKRVVKLGDKEIVLNAPG